MKYFIDESGTIYAYESDGSQDEFIGNKRPVTAKEVDAILNPPPTSEEVIAMAELKRTELLAEAQSTISNWQSKLLLGIINDADKASLIAWLAYIDALNAVDTTKPNWPASPAV